MKYLTQNEVIGNGNKELMPCPDCHGTKLSYNEYMDEYVCDVCGLIIDGNYFDNN